MKKQVSLKVAVFTTLLTLILAVGAVSFAQLMWTHLATCSYTLTMAFSTTDYDVISSGGSTTTGSGKYAYVKAELQRFINGAWKTYYSNSDRDYMIAAVENNVAVAPGYTYRVKTTHQAQDANGNVLEEFVQISDYYVVSMPRP